MPKAHDTIPVVIYFPKKEHGLLNWIKQQADQAEMPIGKFILMKSDLRRQYRGILNVESVQGKPAPLSTINFD